jgi:plasmid stabilization system protein ParE
MAIELILAAEVESDLAGAHAWYEERRAGLGEEFLSCVDACIQAIVRMPGSYPVIHETYQRALLRRFPYAVFFDFRDERVTVYGVFHTSRHPDKWRERLL